MEPSDGSEGPRIESRQSQKRFIKSQVRVGLGILTDLNWHLPSNITIMTNAPSNRGNAYGILQLKHDFLQIIGIGKFFTVEIT